MKKLISLLLAVMMLASMASFAAAKEEKTLVFISQAAWKDQMQVLCDRYYEETGVKVVLENYSFNDMINTIEVKISTGSTDYDILFVDVPLVSSYARRGMLADLSPYFTEEDRAKLVTAAVEASTYEGKLYASPMANSSQVLYYNTKLLEDAGIDLAELEAYSTDNRITYERLVEIAEQALKVLDPDGTQGMIGFDFQQVDRVYQMNQLPNSMGGVQVSEDGYSLDGVLNTEPWKKALTWYQEQVKKGICSRGITASELPNYFYSGKLIFMLGTTEMVANFVKKDMTTYAYTASPAFKGYEDKVATATGSWHVGVSGYSQNTEEAAKFVKWITCTDEATEMFYDLRGMIPTYVPLLDKLANDENTVGWMKLAITESKTTAYPRALTPAFNEYSSVINSVWSDTRNGEDVEETIEWAIEEYAAQTIKYKK